MAYTKTTWTNGSGEAVNETNLNKIETGIKDAHDDIASNYTALETTIDTLAQIMALGGLVYKD